MNKSQAKRRKLNYGDYIAPIKIEPPGDDVMIKMEPFDTYEHEDICSMPETNDNSQMDDEEMGLISELEFIKSEIDVDESMLADFRSEILQESKRHETIGQPVFSTIDYDPNLRLRGRKDKPSKNIIDGTFMRKKKGIIVCPFCDFKTTTRNRSYFLKDHMRIHTGETPFKCDYCNFSSRLSQTLRFHVKNVHHVTALRCELCRIIIFDQEKFDAHKFECVKVRSFECHLCKITYKRVQKHKIREHMRRAHTGEQVFQCTVKNCPDKFVTRARLSHHLQRVHPNTMALICSVCDLRFNDEEKLALHERNCKMRIRYQCHLCGYSYLRMTLSCLKMHMRKHTGDKPFKCNSCSKFFPREEALNQHLQRAHYTFQCRRCHRRCIDAKALETHEMYCRRRRYECYMCGFSRFGISFSKFRRHVVIKHTGESGIKCLSIDCPKRFASKDVFGAHIKRNHPNLLKYLCLICNKSFKITAAKKLHQNDCARKRIECYLCYQTTSNMKKLRIHMVHSHTGEKKYQCAKCLKSFQMEANLKIHMKFHTINKKDLPACNYCHKYFIDNKYKKKHEFQCKKIYECYLCKKTLPNFTQLYEKHFRLHLGERPYQCKYCHKTLASIRCYKLHVINFHLASFKFKCNECNNIIVTRKDFRLHQQNCMKPIRQSANVFYFSCSLCGIGLKRLPQLRDHIIFNKCKKHPQLLSAYMAPSQTRKRKNHAKRS